MRTDFSLPRPNAPATPTEAAASLVAGKLLRPTVCQPLAQGCIPVWLDANIVTIVGGLFTALVALLVFTEAPRGTEPLSRFTLVMASLLFLFQLVAAGVAHVHQRRTGGPRATPLFLSDVVESFTSAVFAVTLSIALRLQTTDQSLLVILFLFLHFTTHWTFLHPQHAAWSLHPQDVRFALNPVLFVLGVYPSLLDTVVHSTTLSNVVSTLLPVVLIVAAAIAVLGLLPSLSETTSFPPLLSYVFFLAVFIITTVVLPMESLKENFWALFIGTTFMSTHLTQLLDYARYTNTQPICDLPTTLFLAFQLVAVLSRRLLLFLFQPDFVLMCVDAFVVFYEIVFVVHAITILK